MTRQAATGAGHLAQEEAELVLKINESLGGIDWKRYYYLVSKRRAETLAHGEQEELISLSDSLEAANAERLEHLAALARLRNISVPVLMDQLGLKPKADV